MKKLLMVAPYFLPRRRVGALRPFKFAIHLREVRVGTPRFDDRLRG
ncbi:MAG: hypothetical protein U5J63_12930 [Fodinibius sp.]|nr:hypothetical protein [Fodinibius sp.]